MKKGFTLIEVLAVLAILGVIAIITVPTIIGVTENSRKEGFTRSIEEIKNIIDMDYNEYARSGAVEYNFQNNTLVCVGCDAGADLELDFTGEIKNGRGTFYNTNGTITLTFENDRYTASDNGNGKITVVKKE